MSLVWGVFPVMISSTAQRPVWRAAKHADTVNTLTHTHTQHRRSIKRGCARSTHRDDDSHMCALVSERSRRSLMMIAVCGAPANTLANIYIFNFTRDTENDASRRDRKSDRDHRQSGLSARAGGDWTTANTCPDCACAYPCIYTLEIYLINGGRGVLLITINSEWCVNVAVAAAAAARSLVHSS